MRNPSDWPPQEEVTIDTVRLYFPTSGTGKMSVTSRNPEGTNVADALGIEVFTREESVELPQG